MAFIKYCEKCGFETIHSSIYCIACKENEEQAEFLKWKEENPSLHDQIENLYWEIIKIKKRTNKSYF